MKIVDDDAEVRRSVAMMVEDADFEAVLAEDQLPPLDDFVSQTVKEVDAVLCDHKLRRTHYAMFDGAEAVAQFYKKGFPAVLCTSYEKADIDSMRRHRRYIPELLQSPADADSIALAFERCVEEFAGHLRPSRKPHRVLIRVEERDEELGMVFVVIPSWNPHEAVRLPLDLFPEEIRPRLTEGAHLFAQVNIGAERQEDLYFLDFEIHDE